MENNNEPKNEITETLYKGMGWDARIQAIKHTVGAILFIIVGGFCMYTYLTTPGTQFGTLELGGVLFIIGIIYAITAWFFLWRSKSLMKGKFYAPEDQQNKIH